MSVTGGVIRLSAFAAVTGAVGLAHWGLHSWRVEPVTLKQTSGGDYAPRDGAAPDPAEGEHGEASPADRSVEPIAETGTGLIGGLQPVWLVDEPPFALADLVDDQGFTDLDGGRQLIEQIEAGPLLGVVLDARLTGDYERSRIPGAYHMPFQRLRPSGDGLDELMDSFISPEFLLVIYCTGGSCESSELTRIELAKKGFGNVVIIKAGFDEWAEAGLPVERGAPGSGEIEGSFAAGQAP